MLMKDIIEYIKGESIAVPKHCMYVATNRVQNKMRNTTVGWFLIMKWGDDSKLWIALKYLKESHPVETAEFSKS